MNNNFILDNHVDCVCNNNKNCIYCNGVGYILNEELKKIYAQSFIYNNRLFNKSTFKTGITIIDFLNSQDRNLPEKLTYIITESGTVNKTSQIPVFTLLRTQNKTVDYALACSISKLFDNIDLAYKTKRFINKTFLVELQYNNKIIELSKVRYSQKSILNY